MRPALSATVPACRSTGLLVERINLSRLGRSPCSYDLFGDRVELGKRAADEEAADHWILGILSLAELCTATYRPRTLQKFKASSVILLLLKNT